jgi:sugar transferase (PEP-CTERM system associated)
VQPGFVAAGALGFRMVKILRMHAPKSVLAMAGIEALMLVGSYYIGLLTSWVDTRAFAGYLPHSLLFSGVLVTMMYSVGLYHGEALSKLSAVAVRLAVAFFLGLIILLLAFYVLPGLTIWRSVMLPGMAVGFALILISRNFAPRVLDMNAFKRRILVIGSGERAAMIEKLEDEPRTSGFTCCGYLEMPGETRVVRNPLVMTQTSTLIDYITENNISEIVVAVQDRRGALPLRSLIDCRLAGVEVIDYQNFYERETGRVDLDAVNSNWFLFSDGFPNSRLHHFFKRSFDIVISFAALALFMPLMALAAIAVRVESPGPIFYRQQRVGFNGKPFELMKFRSMTVDAEKDGVPKWAAAKDSRITAVGAFLRRTRIDEIPQIFAVLRGDMSFVGPRPERPYFVDQLRQKIPFYAERHGVKPGITGWSQLNYSYGASVEDARMKLQYDLYYVKHYGILLDFMILLQTVRVVLWPDGVR